MSDTSPRVPWTAIVTTAIVVLAFLVSMGTGLISIGSNTTQIAINTVELAKQRAAIAAIEQLGSPQLQEMKKRIEVIEATHSALPVEDAKTQGQIEGVQKDIARLDNLMVKKTDEWPIAMQRLATLEAKLEGVLSRAVNLRADLKDHQNEDERRDAARIRMLEDTLLAERNKQVRGGGGP